MLLRFRATNFASLRDEQELSLIALDEHADLATFQVPLTKERVLPVAAVFGANASGKSNIIKAMESAASTIVESHQYWLPEEPIPRWPFRLDRDSRTRPSEFIFDFVHDGVRYEYGFSLDDKSIHEEWLYYWPKGKRTLFERDGMTVEFGPSLTGHKSMIADVVRENSLFLSAGAANNHQQLRSIATWFGGWHRVSSHVPRLAPPTLLDEQAIALLRYADTGVIGSALVQRSPEELDASRGRSRRFRGRRPPSRDAGEADEVNQRMEQQLELIHHAATDSGGEPLPWWWESSGTQSWLHVSRQAIRRLEQGNRLIIDDLGGDLHPLLTAQLVGLFQDPATNKRGAQLIFTGHDVSLLGRHVEHRLHRDQVWLTAKEPDGATRLYPLTEYGRVQDEKGRVRDGKDDIEGRYLQGRYGAVPFFDRSLLPDLTGGADET